jgi:hypothetical protein
VGGDHAFDLGQVDVEPARDDQVLPAVNDEVVALVIAGGDVAGGNGRQGGVCRF